MTVWTFIYTLISNIDIGSGHDQHPSSAEPSTGRVTRWDLYIRSKCFHGDLLSQVALADLKVQQRAATVKQTRRPESELIYPLASGCKRHKQSAPRKSDGGDSHGSPTEVRSFPPSPLQTHTHTLLSLYLPFISRSFVRPERSIERPRRDLRPPQILRGEKQPTAPGGRSGPVGRDRSSQHKHNHHATPDPIEGPGGERRDFG